MRARARRRLVPLNAAPPELPGFPLPGFVGILHGGPADLAARSKQLVRGHEEPVE
ncbi:hypothetical protein [Allostreptomyces psammosilenae]|uniref:Uncharacterized protein n=1 Tax=Allostreptomyces psammosilenae TaxID=1892865 RepID=A0A853A0I5_9ACTN|nr:hypothetical protein [Allostreptomyces psammosilenae]NYI08133.1 hypothetical protein [Allostreptomyces psammosilenae]